MPSDQFATGYRNRASHMPNNYQYHHHRRRDRDFPPPSSTTHRRPNFVIELCSQYSDHNSYNRHEIVTLMGKFTCDPDDFFIYEKGVVAGRFFYQQWPNALETIVYLWEALLDGGLSFMPRLRQNLIVPSDTEELNSRLRVLFSQRIKGFKEGGLVKKWEKRLEQVSNEIAKIDVLLRKPRKYAEHMELSKKKQGFAREKLLIGKRIGEFKSGMECILDYVNGKVFDSSDVKVLKLKGNIVWSKIHWLIKRECRRLDDGLPIYADRKDIIWQIHCQQVGSFFSLIILNHVIYLPDYLLCEMMLQVMVLVGETGSGKSTQLVQFLTDSEIAANNSIVCTQPRKLAATSLATRVQEETRGCSDDTSVTCSPTYSSLQFDSKVIYTTDHCLLQHYMTDKNLSAISCIIVDEAHERSLNTDLLLALIKDLLHRRSDLRLVIMSATADSDQLSKYFFACPTFHVVGRTFPVDVKYVNTTFHSDSGSGSNSNSGLVPGYVSDVVRTVGEIHWNEGPGTVLAFLTSQMEVEWACEQFKVTSIVALPLHGKLSNEEQYRVYQNYPDKRKVIFSTNLAETSLTIPGVKYVVDSGMVKESRFEPTTGTNVLRVSRVSQSSANQRAGRAGRTEPGKCFRLYSESDFRSMALHQEPEIRQVNLGIAVLRILALGIRDVNTFDFIDAPSDSAIETAIKNLVQLGAVVIDNGVHKLTKDGRMLVQLGIEPRLGKMILKCFEHRLGREGVVLAAVMANSSSIFCRVGKEEDKQKSDCYKVQFCHPGGDLFTLLSVYRSWERIPRERRNQWCWDNSINAKSMRRCQEAVIEIENCLQNELNIIIPTYWHWNPESELDSEYNKILRDVILSALSENIAMYSGNDYLGYEVASTGAHVHLHPSCSLLIFNERPNWVVFGEIIAMPNQYLVCVTAVNFESLHALSPPEFNISQIDRRKLQSNVLTGFGSTFLKRFCGKGNSSLKHLLSQIKDAVKDDRIGLEVNVDRNELEIFASIEHVAEVTEFVKASLDREEKWLQNECIEKLLFSGRHTCPVALFGAGGEIKHLELDKKCLTVDVSVSGVSDFEEKELLSFIEAQFSGEICAVHRVNQDSGEKWGRVTFLTPEAAENAVKSSNVEFRGGSMTVVASRHGGENKFSSLQAAVKAKVSWPRRRNRGIAFVKCEKADDIPAIVEDFSMMLIRGRSIRCRPSSKSDDSVMLFGLENDIFENELFDVLKAATTRNFLEIFLPRGMVVQQPPIETLEDALLREIRAFMPVGNHNNNNNNRLNECVRVHIFPPELADYFTKAEISFDGSLHLEAARALEQIDGKPLPGCQSWQKMKSQQLFHSTVSCSASVYTVIKDPLHLLLKKLELQKGAKFFFDKNDNGSYRVKISAKATKIMAESRRPLEELMNGKTITDPRLTAPILQLILSREGYAIQKSIQRETATYFLIDRHNQTIRIFGPLTNIDRAQNRFINALVTLHETKQLDVRLRGPDFPPDLMKKVVEKFGPDLHGLKLKFPGSDFTLNTRHHTISIRGSKEVKQNVEETIRDIVNTSMPQSQSQSQSQTASCPICLCEVEDSFRLESCGHEFCRMCLIEQCESAIKSHSGFPLICAHENCPAMIFMADLRSLLAAEKLEELFRASLGSFVGSSNGKYRYCPSPDCPSVYQVAADDGGGGRAFVCGACSVETCTRCHLEYHPFLSCEKYKEYKRDPDMSLKEWMRGKEDVRVCPSCGFAIEKIDGCNHMECRCGRHICWVCLELFNSSGECYRHLSSVHHANEGLVI
ncbi:hypothetical protein LXL04_015867 [Taraxacum kok-saghyz]